MKKVNFYYSIVDSFPPYRVDIVELFDLLHQSNKAQVEWYMSCNTPNRRLTQSYKRQDVNLPIKFSQGNKFLKIANKFFYWFFDAWFLIKCLFKSVDIIQVRDKYLAAILGLIIAKIKGVKFVYWCSYSFPEHDYESFLNENNVKKKYFYWLRAMFGFSILYRLVIPYGDHTFVQSKQMLSDIENYGVAKSKMTVVPMGAPKRLLNEWGKGVIQESLPGRIVYLGTLASVRRLNVLIDAFSLVHKHNPSATLLIIGEGDFLYERENLEEQVRQLELTACVEFAGFLPIEEAWSLTATAAICVSPFFPTKALASTSPTKLAEYMALGKPVVCNNHPEQSEIVKASGAGLCVEWSAQSFADAILWMLDNPELAAEMGAKGHTWIESNRTYEIIANRVWQTYQEVLEN